MGEPSSVEHHEKPSGVSRRTVIKGMAAVAAGLVVGSPNDTKQEEQKPLEYVGDFKVVPFEKTDNPPTDDLEKEAKTIEHIRAVLDLVLQPAFARACEPNPLTAFDPKTNPEFIKQTLLQGKRSITRHLDTPDKKPFGTESYMFHTIVTDAHLARLLSLVTADEKVNEKLALSERFSIDFYVDIETDEQGSMRSFSLRSHNESEKRLEDMNLANANDLSHDASEKSVDQLYPKRLADKADALRMVFKHVPSKFDTRWRITEGTSFAFLPGEQADVQVGEQKLHFSYYVGGGLLVGGSLGQE